jgi:hypothetical protein
MVLTAVTTECTVLWDVTPHSLVEVYCRFAAMKCSDSACRFRLSCYFLAPLHACRWRCFHVFLRSVGKLLLDYTASLPEDTAP